ncbi:MAG TPA: deoxyribodipyrimidine photo-lyase [Opitutaceae bacterium]|nr:deoxyribodipyrimidine photo-lyase [Opitutaceae bacterium]
MTPAIVWFRQDLRLQDNPALAGAVKRGGPVVPAFIWDPAGDGDWPMGAASRWWLHHSLVSLDESLRARGSRLTILQGDSLKVLRGLAKETGAGAVHWNTRYEPSARARDARVRAVLSGEGIETADHNSALLFEPDSVRNKQGGPYQVFTPFWRHCLSLSVEAPVRLGSGAIKAPLKWPPSKGVGTLRLLPKVRWDGGLARSWTPGEKAGALRLRRFAAQAMEHYAAGRDRPGQDGTSMISPWLHFGEIGPRQVWAAVESASKGSGIFPPGKGAGVFLSEIGWREFAHHLLFHFPATPKVPLRAGFGRFPWAPDPGRRHLRAWQKGLTGYPVVDAGMRQLWETGWMHNRVRMVVASFLVKHLRLDWKNGAEWFWNTLVDADLANNTLGWQWSAGCGADAAPYFRIFAPVRQGERFDPQGAYVRRWVPELAKLPLEFIHHPWDASEELLKSAGVRLGTDYPRPIVDHAKARAAALDAFRRMKSFSGA